LPGSWAEEFAFTALGTSAVSLGRISAVEGLVKLLDLKEGLDIVAED